MLRYISAFPGGVGANDQHEAEQRRNGTDILREYLQSRGEWYIDR
jgi:hypothetical protein